MIRKQQITRLAVIIGAGVLVLMISMPIAAYRSYRVMAMATVTEGDVPEPSWLASMGQIIVGQLNGKQQDELPLKRRVDSLNHFEKSKPVFAKNPFAEKNSDYGINETLFLENPFIGENAGGDDRHFQPNPFIVDRDLQDSSVKWQENPFLVNKTSIQWSENPFERPVHKQSRWISNPFLKSRPSAQ